MRKRLYAYLSIGLVAAAALWLWRSQWRPPPAFTPTPSETGGRGDKETRGQEEGLPLSPSPPLLVTDTPTPTPTAEAMATPTATATPSLTSVLTETLYLEVECDCEQLREEVAALRQPTEQSAGSSRPAEPTEPPPPMPAPAEATPAPLAAAALPPAPTAPTAGERLALANYFPWYDGNGWDACNLCDRPLEPYHSDDPAAIRRHVQQALAVGLDGFTSQWLAVGDRTDRNFAQLLEQSRGTTFRSTIVFSRHMLPVSPSQETLVGALRYVMATYADHPNFLRADGQPVLFFTDVYRVPVAAGQSPQEAWEAIRSQVDAERAALWIAEGLDPSYLAVFDGLYVHKITHAAYPDDYVKASRWAGQVRAWAQRSGQRKVWVATVSPGWDDTRAGCRADVRVPNPPHRRSREEGAFYRATFASALQSQPDWLWVNSFNEWVECTHIEPGVAYGDLYLQLTREFVQQFKLAQ
ncbi:MAG: glycoside hydrolase family 99-like domain-containing protein [Anaerolineae bacterium]|nr:glycoside hydrolase family 99-like domain-containing protein [Anaerolineae bacterium]